jgi:hypothetical protein
MVCPMAQGRKKQTSSRQQVWALDRTGTYRFAANEASTEQQLSRWTLERGLNERGVEAEIVWKMVRLREE